MIAVISGATRGIGREIAFTLASRGFWLALGARGQKELEELKGELETICPGAKVLVYTLDFGQKEEVAGFTKEILRWGEVSVIVNNVGTFKPGYLSFEDDLDFERHMSVNLFGAWYLTHPLLVGMKARQKGHIFNICSTASLHPRPEAASYSISKMAFYAFHKVLCEEMRDYNIKVTAILPRSVNTSSWEGSAAPVHNFIQASDIAKAVLFALDNSMHAFTEEIVIRPMDRNI